MTKKKINLAASMSATVDKIFTPAVPDTPHEAAAPHTTEAKEVPAQTSTGAKSGRPKTVTEEVAPLTVRLPKTLLHELKLRAVMEHTTQTEIVATLIKGYLNK